LKGREGEQFSFPANFAISVGLCSFSRKVFGDKGGVGAAEEKKIARGTLPTP